MSDIEDEILSYHFRTIDVEKIELDRISDINPLKLVFKMAKDLLDTKATDEDIFEAKIRLSEELNKNCIVKNSEQVKALVDFLGYLFLFQNQEFEKKFEDYKNERGGVFKMTIEEIRRLHYKAEGREEGREEEKKQLILKQYSKGLSIEYIAEINDFSIEYVKSVIEN